VLALLARWAPPLPLSQKGLCGGGRPCPPKTALAQGTVAAPAPPLTLAPPGACACA